MKKFIAKKSRSRMIRKRRKLRAAHAAKVQNRGQRCLHALGNSRDRLTVRTRLQLKKKIRRLSLLKTRPWLMVLL